MIKIKSQQEAELAEQISAAELEEMHCAKGCVWWMVGIVILGIVLLCIKLL